MKVLILGSSGQIGAYLTEYLRKKDHEVIEYDKNIGPQYNLTAIPSTWLESCIKKQTLFSSLPLMWVVLGI